jgi:hypothetical protein
VVDKAVIVRETDDLKTQPATPACIACGAVEPARLCLPAGSYAGS